jgi:hypothetical protein
VTTLSAWLTAALVPVLLASAVSLAALGIRLVEPVEAGCGVLVAVLAAMLERRRGNAAEDRMVRMRTRLRVVRHRADSELAELRQQARALDLELWEFRLLDQLSPQARTLISGMAAALSRDGDPQQVAQPGAAQPGAEQPVPVEVRQDREWFDTQPIDLAPIQAAAQPGPRPSLPLQPEPPTVDLPVLEPVLEPGTIPQSTPAATTTQAAVVDLRAKASPAQPPVDIAELDEQVYRQLAEAVQDELTAALEPPPRRPATGTGASCGDTARLPDDPGRRSA